jgi:ankyrin repeat protein
VIAGYPGEESGIKVARILLANGASTGIQDLSGKTPLEIAQQKGLSQLVELLQKGM